MNSINNNTAELYESLDLYNNPDLNKIITCPKIKLGNWPTPLICYTQLENFSVKRDDLSGYGRGGIKVRKLESILAHIKNYNYKNILTLVPNISNLRADLELFEQTSENELGLNLLISNIPPLNNKLREEIIENRKGNYLLVGTSTLLISLKMIMRWFKLRKEKTMLILPSLMHPASVIGAANGLIELYEQCKVEDKPLPKHIFISGCTGSSAAGLILSSKLLKKLKLADIQINTIKVFPGMLKVWIWFVLYWTKIRYKLDISISFSDIIIYTKHSDVPYGSSDPALIEICKNVKANFDLNLDPIYGARAWSVMTEFLKNKYKGEQILYWHCGYTPDWRIGLSSK